jgi:hypothetical protein
LVGGGLGAHERGVEKFFPKFGRGGARLFFEEIGERRGVVKVQQIGDLGNGFIGREERLRFVRSLFHDIFLNGYAEGLFEEVGKIGIVHVYEVGQIFDVDLFADVLIDIFKNGGEAFDVHLGVDSRILEKIGNEQLQGAVDR